MASPLRLEQNQGYLRNISGIPVLKKNQRWCRPVSVVAAKTGSETSEPGRTQPWLKPLRLVPRHNLVSQGRLVKPVECSCRLRTDEPDEQPVHRSVVRSVSADQIKPFQRERKILKEKKDKLFGWSHLFQELNNQKKCLPKSYPSRISNYQTYTRNPDFSEITSNRVKYYPLVEHKHSPIIDQVPVKEKLNGKSHLHSPSHYQEHFQLRDQLPDQTYYSKDISPYRSNRSNIRDGLADSPCSSSVDSHSQNQEMSFQYSKPPYSQNVQTCSPIHPDHLSHSHLQTQESISRPTKTLSQFVQACFPTPPENKSECQMSDAGVQTFPESFSDSLNTGGYILSKQIQSSKAPGYSGGPSEFSPISSRRRSRFESPPVLYLGRDSFTNKPSSTSETQQNLQTKTSKQQNNRLLPENININNKIATQDIESDYFSQNEMSSSIGTGGTRDKCTLFKKKFFNLPIIPDNPSEKTLYIPYNIEDEFDSFESKGSINLPYTKEKMDDFQANIDSKKGKEMNEDEVCVVEDIERLIAAETADIEYARAARCREMQNVLSITTSNEKEKQDCGKLITPDLDQVDSVDSRAAAALVQAEENGFNLTESPKQFFRKLFPDQEVHEISAAVATCGSNINVAVPRSLADISCQQPQSFEDAAMLDFFYNAPPGEKVRFKNTNKDGDGDEELEWKVLGTGHTENGELNNFVLMARSKESETGSLVQQRGSKAPNWFAGYFYKLPSSSTVEKCKDPFEVLEWAWKAALSSKVYTKNGVVIIGI